MQRSTSASLATTDLPPLFEGLENLTQQQQTDTPHTSPQKKQVRHTMKHNVIQSERAMDLADFVRSLFQLPFNSPSAANRMSGSGSVSRLRVVHDSCASLLRTRMQTTRGCALVHIGGKLNRSFSLAARLCVVAQQEMQDDTNAQQAADGGGGAQNSAAQVSCSAVVAREFDAMCMCSFCSPHNVSLFPSTSLDRCFTSIQRCNACPVDGGKEGLADDHAS